MRSLPLPLVDLGGPSAAGAGTALVACSRSKVSLVRQLARHVGARRGEIGTATRSLARLVADGRAFTEFVDGRFGLRKLANVKPKHVRAWLEDLRARGRGWREVRERADSLAALGLLRPVHVKRIVHTIRAR